ncbi:hypothetical protein B7P43_G11042 [Cryptotermes secundus]|uniref:Uncharacterized protein n=1 Tax=Cryptotermes secundus TaxID=105785 RepID=A0A2J7RFI9_9NEOP|nr:hypothetical protein B7P43_G11042 [Cryptotermes secundus]
MFTEITAVLLESYQMSEMQTYEYSAKASGTAAKSERTAVGSLSGDCEMCQISATSAHHSGSQHHLNQSPPPSGGSGMNYQTSHQLPPPPSSLAIMGTVAPTSTGDADHVVPPTSDMGPSTTWPPMTTTPASTQPHHHHRNMATPPPASLMNSNHTSTAAGITSFSHQSGFMPQSRPHHHQPFYSWY